MLPRALRFLRPTFAALVGFAFVAGVANLFWSPEHGGLSLASPKATDVGSLEGLDLTRVVLPSPGMAPEDVVRLQLAGLGDSRADGVGILQCFCFASPANRAVTGPLDRFGAMVRQDPFRCLARPRALLVGRPRLDSHVARVLVTVIDDQSRIRAFTFVLARQQDAPFRDCWMTDAVLPATAATDPASAPAAPAV